MASGNVPATGPSPRVRGAGRRPQPPPRRHGTIPAGAGSRSSAKRLRPPLRDHPCGCGEQDRCGRRSGPGEGPSPRVRGADQPERHPRHRRGTIPAGAGSRQQLYYLNRFGGDHPRGCGEQTWYLRRQPDHRGPSPRVRGAVHAADRGEVGAGTVPAGAGSRARRIEVLHSDGDHPRGCGEQSTTSALRAASAGPSPRVRGAGPRPSQGRAARGTIPAGAGSSGLSTTIVDSGRDHPRGCGEQANPRAVPYRGSGPSPRVRGAAGPCPRRPAR